MSLTPMVHKERGSTSTHTEMHRGEPTNTATSTSNHVIGGTGDTATSKFNHVVGWTGNTATPTSNHVVGGTADTATSKSNHVVGRTGNTATPTSNHVFGGTGNTATLDTIREMIIWNKRCAVPEWHVPWQIHQNKCMQKLMDWETRETTVSRTFRKLHEAHR